MIVTQPLPSAFMAEVFVRYYWGLCYFVLCVQKSEQFRRICSLPPDWEQSRAKQEKVHLSNETCYNLIFILFDKILCEKHKMKVEFPCLIFLRHL